MLNVVEHFQQHQKQQAKSIILDRNFKEGKSKYREKLIGNVPSNYFEIGHHEIKI